MGFLGFGEGGDRKAKPGYRHSNMSKLFPPGSHASRFFQVGHGSISEGYTDWIDENIANPLSYLFGGEFMDHAAVSEAYDLLQPEYQEMQDDYDNMKDVYEGATRVNDSLMVQNQELRAEYDSLYQTIQNLQRANSPLGNMLQNIGRNKGSVPSMQQMLSPASYAMPNMTKVAPGDGGNLINNVWQGVLQNQARRDSLNRP